MVRADLRQQLPERPLPLVGRHDEQAPAEPEPAY
jgi:hypothetical protein